MDYIQRGRVAEANVQAELYRQLKNGGIDCVLEHKIYPQGQRGCRLDCVVVKDDKIVVIIEVKNHVKPGSPDSDRWWRSKQSARYAAFGVPLLLCPSHEDIAATVQGVQDILGKTVRQ